MLAETSPSTTAPVVVANVTKVFPVARIYMLIKVDFDLKLESATFPTATDGSARSLSD